MLVIDEDGTIAAGKALDIQQSGAVEGFHTRGQCPAISRAWPEPRWRWLRIRGARQGGTAGAGLAMIARLKGFIGAAPIVFAGAAQSI